MTYVERRKLLDKMVAEQERRIAGMRFTDIDYEAIARLMTYEAGAPVVCFPAPRTPAQNDFVLCAYEVPQPP